MSESDSNLYMIGENVNNNEVPQQLIIEKVNMDAIDGFCREIYYCDPYTAMHAEHVADLMAGLATQMSMSAEEINLAYVVGVVHDVGKIKTPEAILTKPARLTDEEYKIMKRHSIDGAEMLSAIAGTEPIVPVMRHHHERYDGKGYPDGLIGKEIPLLSRMLAICDSFDAMTTHRCYKSPMTLPESLIEIKKCAGSQFDPEICQAFFEFIRERFGFELDTET
ncbi:MAG: HD-GYP domain-containing protein [Veillonellaceae bacterium]|nr:HD-GYP domain-containing protein [Veillonellaceae bacterium]